MKIIQIFVISLVMSLSVTAQNHPQPKVDVAFGIDPIPENPVSNDDLKIPSQSDQQIQPNFDIKNPQIVEPNLSEIKNNDKQYNSINSDLFSNQNFREQPKQDQQTNVNRASQQERTKIDQNGGGKKSENMKDQRMQMMRKRRQEIEKRKKQKFGTASGYAQDTINIGTNRIKQQIAKANLARQKFSAMENSSKHLSTINFELTRAQSQFYLQYVTNMPVYISVKVLVEDGNTFKLPDNSEKTSPLTFNIMEDNVRYIARQNVHYTFGITFEARKGINYALIFKDNSPVKQLVEVTFTTTIPTDTLDSLIQKHQAQPYISDIKKLAGSLNSEIARIKRFDFIDQHNTFTITEATKKYSKYQFTQMIIVVIVNVIQLQLIRNLFKNSSIL